VRRTTTHDSLRPEGLTGPVIVDGRGRDLHTDADGTTTVLSSARLDATIRFLPDREVLAVSVEPSAQAIDQLVGARASAGFREAVDRALPGERTTGSLRFQLLDDLPTATLVSGYALGAGGLRPKKGTIRVLQHPDLCAGWAVGGTLLQEIDQHHHVPVVTGPEAPDLQLADDPLGWHETGELTAHGMRRRRLLDVWWEHDEVAVEGFFRDSHLDPEGLETVIHEYTVRAAVDPADMRFTACDASIGALPWVECPAAAASAGRLAGAPVDGLRRWVRETFVGPTTCTHLNDTLRSLEDIGALLAALPEGSKRGFP
jgi:hypothetical protein